MNETFFVRVDDVIYKISEGTGDNLSPEDIEAGFKDYVYYDKFNLYKEELFGGMIILMMPFKEKYSSLTDCLKDVLETDIPEADESTMNDIIERAIIYHCDDIKNLPEEAFESREYEYYYGMRARGCSIGTQPKDGFLYRKDSDVRMYYDIIVYDRELTRKERDEYSLDLIDSLRFLTKSEIRKLFGKKTLAILLPDGIDKEVDDLYSVEDCMRDVSRGAKVYVA